MRITQAMGLPNDAVKFLEDNAIKINFCQHCWRHDGFRKEPIGMYGMASEMSLYQYSLRNGDVATEFIQHTEWDSGLIIWLGLKVPGGEFLWTDASMELPEWEGENGT